MDNLFTILTFLPEKALQKEIQTHGKVLDFEKNDVIVREGEYVSILPIVLEGNIRVFQHKEDREILLYYVEQGQTCMMSLSACFFDHASAIKAIATEPTRVLAIPRKFIALWQREYDSWNKFVIKTFRKRYDELLDAFERVAFDHIDQRIWDYLHFRKEKDAMHRIQISHQMLADELGTTRVVVSRILKQFEEAGKVVLHRGSIELK